MDKSSDPDVSVHDGEGGQVGVQYQLSVTHSVPSPRYTPDRCVHSVGVSASRHSPKRQHAPVNSEVDVGVGGVGVDVGVGDGVGGGVRDGVGVGDKVGVGVGDGVGDGVGVGQHSVKQTVSTSVVVYDVVVCNVSHESPYLSVTVIS